MQATSTGRQDGDEWVPLAVARDADTADEWVSALDDAGIDAEVRIGDAVNLTSGSSFWPTASPGGHQFFAYPLFVPAGQREAAAGVLIERGWDGRHGQVGRTPVDPAFVLRGALFATLAGGVVALLLLWRGG